MRFLSKIFAKAGINSNFFELDTTVTGIPGGVGKIVWNDTDGTIEFQMKGGNVTQQVGQELPLLVKHADNIGLTNGKVVYSVGSDGDNQTVRYAQANSEITSSKTFGVMTEDASGGAKAFCTVFGIVRDIDTSSLTEGAIVWLSDSVAGGMTTTRPEAPSHSVMIGLCLRSHANVGKIFVSVNNGVELDELHNVSISGALNNDVLVYESISSLWKAKSISTILGYTPVTSARTLTINGVTYDLSANRTWTITASASARNIQKFTATSGQTSFTITGGYTPGMVDVFINGTKLDAASGVEYTATDGSTVVLTSGAFLNDIVEVYSYVSAYTANNALRQVTSFTATAGQTSFTVTYSLGLLDVYYNGSKLAASEYNATSGTAIVLNTACLANDIVEVIAYNYTVGAFTGVGGTGTAGYVPKFTSSNVIGNSLIYSNTSAVTIGNTNGVRAFSIYSGTADNHMGIYGVAPSVSLTDAPSGGSYQAKFALATSNGQFATGAVAGDFVISCQTGATIWAANSVEKMRLSSTGVLAIGTTSISDEGNLFLGAKSTTEGGQLVLQKGTSQTYAAHIDNFTNQLRFLSGTDTATSSVKMMIDLSTGNVGIGTSNPSQLLHVYGSAAWVMAETNSTGSARFQAKNTIQTTDFGTDGTGGFIQTQGNYPFVFYTNQVERMRILSGGGVRLQDATELQWKDGNVAIGGGGAANILYFNTNSTEKMRITSSGNVGIGTSSPYDFGLSTMRTLHVEGSSYGTVIAKSGAVGSFLISDSTAAMQAATGTYTNHPFIITTNNTERMRITSGGVIQAAADGVIQIPMSSTTSVTNVSGLSFQSRYSTTYIQSWNAAVNAYAGIYINSAYIGTSSLGTGTVYSNGGTLTNTNPSDIRLKKNIQELSWGLNEILQLKPVSYNWIEDRANQGKQFGFIAQDVQEIIPELVKEFTIPANKELGTEELIRLGLDKEAIFTGLVKSIQEVVVKYDNKIQEQQAQIEQLKSLIK